MQMVEMRLLVLKIIQQRLLPKQSLKGVLLQENKKQIQRDCWKVKEFSYREFKMSIKTARERWPNAICMINISKAYLIPDCNHGFWGCPFKSKENWSWSIWMIPVLLYFLINRQTIGGINILNWMYLSFLDVAFARDSQRVFHLDFSPL